MTDETALEAAKVLVLNRFDLFFKAAFHLIEPAQPLVWGRHLDAICEHLQAVTEGQIRNLVITMPPRHGKSMAIRLWSAWGFLRDAKLRQIAASYDLKLARAHNVDVRNILKSQWAADNFEPGWSITSGQDTKDYFTTSEKGHRMITSVGSNSTGHGGFQLIIDDALAATESPSAMSLGTMKKWYRFQLRNRLENPKTSSKIITNQRTHDMDLVGVTKTDYPGEFEYLNLMTEFDPHRKSSTSIGWSDWRTEEGELLWEERFGPEEIESEKANGAYYWNSQHQQNPTPETGGIFEPQLFNYWSDDDSPPLAFVNEKGKLKQHRQIKLPPLDEMDVIIQSWDIAWTGNKTSDNSAGQVWGKKGHDLFLLDTDVGKYWPDEAIARIQKMKEGWPAVRYHYIEKAAGGIEAVNQLKKVYGNTVVAVKPTGTKEVRAMAIRGLMKNVWLPHPHERTWVNDLTAELTSFPNAAHDDQVDALTQALSQLHMLEPPKRRGKIRVGSF